ncbi:MULTISPECIES: papain fold toxin domain-containing protein [Planktothrix]|uniref:papain fold toxin domain-containing protein n=1 Tax=Planktothrix TaxID=54304 RepID=UPI0003FA7472|nr:MULTISPECIES: papain fold toxin domain-containing protein [Planktothrix]
MNYLTPKQKQDLAEIANNHPNLQCVQCALAIKKYLQLAEIKGKLIKINAQADLDYRNCFLYDDSIGGDAISETGYHEGVIIIIDGVEIVFDNHHPQGIPKIEWLANFQFFGKIHLGQELIITEEDF